MLEDWEPSYFRAVKGEPSLTDPEQIKAYWRKRSEELAREVADRA